MTLSTKIVISKPVHRGVLTGGGRLGRHLAQTFFRSFQRVLSFYECEIFREGSQGLYASIPAKKKFLSLSDKKCEFFSRGAIKILSLECQFYCSILKRQSFSDFSQIWPD